jgi:hypothetical protein
MSRSHWDDVPGHPVEDWQYEVRNGDTRQSYTEWVAGRVDADPDEYCRTCSEPYDGHGDGYDGECPSCADKTEAKRLEEEGGCGDDDDGCPPREPSETLQIPIPPPAPRFTQEGVSYTLSMTSAQAGVVMLACELFMRMRMGQVHNCLSEHLPWSGNFVSQRHEALRATCRSLGRYLRDNINGYSSSYGVTSENLDPHAKVAADLHDVIRYRLAWDSVKDSREPGPFVQYDKPMHWGREPLATITKQE